MKLIDKDALVAEIDRLFDSHSSKHDIDEAGVVLLQLRENVETLEVKEVDLEKEIEEHAIDMPMSEFTHESEVEDFLEWARKEFRYFFELGLNASNPLTWEDVRLLDILCCGVDVHCDLEEKEHYEEILKRFKAQKGEKV